MRLQLKVRKPELRGTDAPHRIDRKNITAAESSSACSRVARSPVKSQDKTEGNE